MPRRSEAAETPGEFYEDPPLLSPDEPVFDESESLQMSPELRAFLFMIRSAEHLRGDALSGAAYQTFYGGARFSNLNDHPVLTGERVGVPLSDSMCRNAGLGPGCVSTAAGAYQIIRPTWSRVRQAGAWGAYLPDFSPASQDEAARRLLIECGALPLIDAGDIVGAVKRAGRLWASLPGSSAKQNPKTIDQALALYSEGLVTG
jgi:lysozyme